jgi:mannose-6-phosphate isomerase-like protein (cupin superfamily)
MKENLGGQNMNKTLLAPVVTRKSLDNTYQYAGGIVSILLSGGETGGQLAVWESVQKPGSEPPLHVHHTTDETFLVMEGAMRFMVGDQILDAPAGSVVFAPRGVPHTFKIKSPQARAITLCTPAGFEEWFRELGQPAVSFDLLDHPRQFSEAEVKKMIALSRRLDGEIIREVDF